MNHKRAIELVIITCALISLSLIGCKALNKAWDKATDKILIMPSLPEGPSLSHMQFDDIPVPNYFKHQPDDSTVYMNANLRTAHIRYLGSARLDDVVDFYLKQMPHQKWAFTTSLILEQKKKLLFEKGDERCEVLIENKEAMTFIDIMINHK